MSLLYGLLILAFTRSCLVVGQCSINIPDDLNGEEAPVVLVKTGNNVKLFRPEEKTTTFPKGTELLLACTGEGNGLKSNGQETTTLSCNGNQFESAAKEKLKDMSCKSMAKAVVEQTTKRCMGNDFNLYEAGYKVNGKFYGSVYDICYNGKGQSSGYTHNFIYGRTWKYKLPEKPYEHYSSRDPQAGKDLDKLYKEQKERFKNTKVNGKPLLDDEHYFTEGQLTPDTSIITGADKLSTYDYANIAPLFKDIYDGNIWRYENMTQELADQRQATFEEYTGGFYSYEVEKWKPIGLDNAEFPTHRVPKYIYKLVVDTESKDGIVFVTLNDPYHKSPASENLCKDICSEANINEKISRMSKRVTQSAGSYGDFGNRIRTLPKDIYVKGLLKY
uniref:Tsal2 protein n=1 Tax=Glossina morsitans morsitans TaxID=37546 RepID=Q9NBA4_GLOMM|nr:Tsal2 protein precursor [Glossina morsitans morsitans]